MENIDELSLKLDRLSRLTESEFAAIAWKEDGHMVWKHAVGNLNERYKQIMHRPGKGLAGTVFRIGRSMMLDTMQPGGEMERRGFPIMLAENLHSIMAAPIHYRGVNYGVLLVGRRSLTKYERSMMKVVEEEAARLASLWLQQI